MGEQESLTKEQKALNKAVAAAVKASVGAAKASFDGLIQAAKDAGNKNSAKVLMDTKKVVLAAAVAKSE